MNRCLNPQIASGYSSMSQKIRVMSEAWVSKFGFCPNCGDCLSGFENNRPVADFFCPSCDQEYELKSKKNTLGKKINDGAYETMMKRLESYNNPNLFILSYDLNNYKVKNFLIVPKFLFVPSLIEKRKPLSLNAKRAGWTGCNILIDEIPKSGKIFYIKDSVPQNKNKVLTNWKKIMFLNEKTNNNNLKGWILDVMKCIDLLGKKEFSLEDIYSFEEALKLKHPNNSHVKDKIRQQLQYLRDKGYLEFISKGQYRVI